MLLTAIEAAIITSVLPTVINSVPADTVNLMREGLIPDRIECLRLGARTVQVVFVGVYRYVRVYRLIVCNNIFITPTPQFS